VGWGVGFLEARGDLDGGAVVNLDVGKDEFGVLDSFPGEEAVDGHGLALFELGSAGCPREVIWAVLALGTGWKRKRGIA
jgi:hypothetical protein